MNEEKTEHHPNDSCLNSREDLITSNELQRFSVISCSSLNRYKILLAGQAGRHRFIRSLQIADFRKQFRYFPIVLRRIS